MNFPSPFRSSGGRRSARLPILMVVSQILASKFTQPPTAAPQQGGAQMKLMTYALPVVFLFILYDMPSGLVLYWTVQKSSPPSSRCTSTR